MARNLALLLPALLLACDAGSTPAGDTDDGSSSTGGTSGADPEGTTSGETTDGPETTDDDTSGGPDDTSGGPDDTTGDTTGSDDTTGDTTGSDDTTGDESSSTTDDPQSVCGDGVIEGDEVCDDGDDNGEYEQCADDCSGPGPFCGDGQTDAAFEQCDDGDAVDGNGCNVDCVVSGSTMWEVTKTTIGSSSFDIGLDVAALDDGTIRMGQRSEPTSSSQQIIITDYDADGTETDEHTFVNGAPAALNMGIWSMDASGGYLLSYSSISVGPSNDPDNVEARDAGHLIDWSTELRSASDIERRPGGGGVYTDRASSLDPVQWFVVDASGNSTYTATADEAIFHGTVSPDGDDAVYIAGGVDVGGFQPTLTRFGTDGTMQWREFYDLPDGGDLTAWTQSVMAVGSDGRVALANDVGLSNNNEVLISVFANDGTLLWDTFYAHDGTDDVTTIHDIAVDSQGNVVVVGTVRTGPFGSWDSDALVIKYDASGTFLWSRTFSGDVTMGSESARGVRHLDDDSIVVTGAREDIENAPDAWLVRLAP